MKSLRSLGRTGIMVTPIGLGCWQFSKQNNMAGRFWPTLEDNLKAAGKKPDEVIVATKWWPIFRFASNIRKTINKRIIILDPYPIDLYQVHQPWTDLLSAGFFRL